MILQVLENIILLVLLLTSLNAGVAYSAQQFYITASPGDSCPRHATCFTLSKFTDYTDSRTSNNDSHVTLHFLPGHHTLDRELTVSNKSNFSMVKHGKMEERDRKVFVECVNQTGTFTITSTTSVSLKDMNFIGCENTNLVAHVQNLTIENSIFQGTAETSDSKSTDRRTLVLHDVHLTRILESTFTSTTRPLTLVNCSLWIHKI